MKKGLCLCLAMVLFVMCVPFVNAEDYTVFQEPFSIRNGITYGMSIDDVMALEEANGNGQYATDITETDFGQSINYEGLSVAGIGGSDVYYRFGNDGLYDIGYNLGGAYSSLSSAQNVYDEVKQSLTEKYGVPLNDSDTVFGIYSKEMETMLIFGSVINLKGNFCQWVVEYEDCWCVIDLVVYGSTKVSSLCRIGYRLVTDEEMSAYIVDATAEAEDKNAERNSDL